MLNFKRKKNGFTLVEMAVVITVLAILIAVLVPSVKKHLDSAKKVTVQSQCREIVIAVETYNSEVIKENEITCEDKPRLLASLDGGDVKSKVTTFKDVLKIVRIQELLGDITNEDTPFDRDKEPSNKLKSRFARIPEGAPYSLIKNVAEGSHFTINSHGELSKVYVEDGNVMKDVLAKE